MRHDQPILTIIKSGCHIERRYCNSELSFFIFIINRLYVETFRHTFTLLLLYLFDVYYSIIRAMVHSQTRLTNSHLVPYNL
ncbi:hypothetical protein AB4K20DRAFT_1921309 [Rhizopus microsporus]